MAGLHECYGCHYRFESAEDLEEHQTPGGCPAAEPPC